MSDQPATRPKTRQWRSTQPRLAPDEAARQGAAARLAWRTFEDRDRAVAFLNGEDAILGGRPIDIAIASPEGLLAVEQAIARSAGEASQPARDPQARAAAAHNPMSPTD